MTTNPKALLLTVAITGVGLALPPEAQEASPEMSFFVTSVGVGDGANLGGL